MIVSTKVIALFLVILILLGGTVVSFILETIEEMRNGSDTD